MSLAERVRAKNPHVIRSKQSGTEWAPGLPLGWVTAERQMYHTGQRPHKRTNRLDPKRETIGHKTRSVRDIGRHLRKPEFYNLQQNWKTTWKMREDNNVCFWVFFIPKEYNIKQALSNFALLWDKVLNAVEKLQFVWLEYSVTCNHISLTQLCSRWQAEYSVIKHSMPCSTHLLSLENPMVSSPHRRNLYNPNTKASITTRTKHHQEQTSCLYNESIRAAQWCSS